MSSRFVTSQRYREVYSKSRGKSWRSRLRKKPVGTFPTEERAANARSRCVLMRFAVFGVLWCSSFLKDACAVMHIMHAASIP